MPRKQGAVARTVPLRALRYDLDALLEAITPRTKLVYVCHPNNPTGTMNTRAELDVFFERLPEHVLAVVDQAYFEYVDDPDYPDAVARYFKAGRRVLVLRTFSKIYGLAGVRVGYGVGPRDVVAAMAKLRRPFDVTTTAQVAALASLTDADDEIARPARVEQRRPTRLAATLREHGLEPAAGAVGNFLYVEVGDDAPALYEALLREGVIVRPLAGFGAPTALRISVGTPDENAFFSHALGRVLAASTSPELALVLSRPLGDPGGERAVRAAERRFHPERFPHRLLRRRPRRGAALTHGDPEPVVEPLDLERAPIRRVCPPGHAPGVSPSTTNVNSRPVS